jgi:hypothetical protein
MPFYRVIVRQDAWIKHEGYLEAKSAEEAAELGLAAWNGSRTLDVPLRPTGENEGFDAAICAPEDCEEIDGQEFQADLPAPFLLARENVGDVRINYLSHRRLNVIISGNRITYCVPRDDAIGLHGVYHLKSLLQPHCRASLNRIATGGLGWVRFVRAKATGKGGRLLDWVTATSTGRFPLH